MVVDVESRAESMMGGKMAARACDACMRRSRASWYCPADDAFLCQSCDASIHSANHLSKRHERVQLQSSSTLPELMTATRDKTTSVWYEGFRRKARTPRNKLSQIEDVNNSNDPLVPELGVEEEEEDGFFSFSSTDENEESLNCCVPVFNTFSDMVIDDIDSFGLVPDGVNNSANGEELGELEREIMGNEGLIEFLPLDMDLGELITMDVESLLEEEEPCLGVKELNSIGVIKEENNVGFEISSKELERVKDEEEEEAKCVDGGSRDGDREASKDEDRKMSLFLRLDYESVISAWDNHGSPWKTGIKPEFNLGDCWRECLLGGNTYPSHVMGGFEELASAVGSVTRQQGRDGGRSNGERGAKVLRYREKRRTRLFAKKIRYEVRKLNAEQRPRIKDKVVLVSYNLLGVDNASNHMDLYYNVPPKHLEWSRRKHLICKEISRYNASILCLQEVDRFDELDGLLRNRGFRGVHKSRTGEASDGCAIFWKEKLFKLLDHQHIEFDRFGMRNNVAQLCVLEMNHEDPKSKLSVRSPEQTSTSPRRLVVGNIHVLFNPKRGDIKLGQVRLFLEKAYKLSQEWGNIPVAIAGDLNSTPQSAIYDFIASADLDTQLHDRRQVSGQSEMEPNERSFRNHYAVSAAVSISRSLPNEWSQEELQLATGGQATTHVQHQLKLHSAYSGVPGTHRTRDQRGEPLATTYHSRSHGTVDYIWHTKELVPVRVLETLPTDVLRRAGGLPSEKWGSDHLAIACELGFVNE